jgi:hypothetical protein
MMASVSFKEESEAEISFKLFLESLGSLSRSSMYQSLSSSSGDLFPDRGTTNVFIAAPLSGIKETR